MKMPKEVKIYCKKCKKHTKHKLKLVKGKKARALSKGTRKFQRKHKKGYGGKAKFIIKKKKQNVKPAFVAECIECKTKTHFVYAKRMKKVEFK